MGQPLGQDRGGGARAALAPSDMNTVPPIPFPTPRFDFCALQLWGLSLGVLELLRVLTAQLMAGGMLEPMGLE